MMQAKVYMHENFEGILAEDDEGYHFHNTER